MATRKERLDKLTQKQDEYTANLVMIVQQNTPCHDSCKECKLRVKEETFGTTCIHMILKRIVDEMVK